jgi:hypothetical protein
MKKLNSINQKLLLYSIFIQKRTRVNKFVYVYNNIEIIIILDFKDLI